MRSVLILGAGLLQRPAILAAKRLGYRAVVVDGNARAVCAPMADEFHHIDLKDKEGILELAKSLMGGTSAPVVECFRGEAEKMYRNDQGASSLAAVFTAGTDFSASVAYVTERLGLPGHSYEAAMNASDKGRMRECFRRAGVPSPRFCTVTSIAEGLDAVKQLSGSSSATPAIMSGRGVSRRPAPCVAKPVDNMGARGCRMVRTPDEAEEAIRDALSSSRTGRAIVEEYMDGPEYSIDALVFDGEVTVTGFADRHIYWPPYFIETGHTMPTTADEARRTALIETFARGIAALGLTRGAAKADIKWTSRGPMVGEIAARLSGGYMSGWTFPYASGLNLTEQALLIACGRKPEALIRGRKPVIASDSEAISHNNGCPLATEIASRVAQEGSNRNDVMDVPFALYDYPCNAVCAERAWVSIPGTVAEVVGVDDISPLSGSSSAPALCAVAGVYRDDPCAGVKDVFPRVVVGDEVDFPRNNVQKCGNVIAVAPTREEAVQAAENAAAGVVVVLEPHNPKTDAFLGGYRKKSDGSRHCERFQPSAASEAWREATPDFPPSAYDVSDEVWDEVAHMGGVLRPGDKAAECIPPVVECFLERSDKKCIETTSSPAMLDFNRRTLKDTLVLFDKLSSGRTCDVPLSAFWKAVIRGGVQGALYAAGV